MFEDLIGEGVSILLTGRKGAKETYSGRIKDVTNGFVLLEMKSHPTLTHIYIRQDQIESMWIYRKWSDDAPSS